MVLATEKMDGWSYRYFANGNLTLSEILIDCASDRIYFMSSSKIFYFNTLIEGFHLNEVKFI